jgi:hypothetical protein
MKRDWLRRYPPLVTFVLALLAAFIILPSALTLPNSNPTTVLEYAPVPPDKDEPPPPQAGSLSQLGLGTSSSISTGAPDLPPPVLPGGKGARPITKKCVGKPLRQTEDPNSPPCVPHFEGSNGGTTFQGVTKDEITVLVYATSYTNIPDQNGDQAEDGPNAGTYCDVDAPPESDPNCLDQLAKTRDHREVNIARAFSRYFNDRFQTYNRHVHFYVYYSSGGATPSSRRADAADNWTTLKPFAVIDRAIFGGNNAAYAEAMVRNNVSVFGNFTALEGAYYRKYAPFIWSFWPDIEHWAANYSNYVCKKIVPHPAAIHAGGTLANKARVYGFLSANDPTYPGLKLFADLARQKLAACGVKAAEDVTFPRHQYTIDTSPQEVQAARTNIAKLQSANVTTILWLGGYETQHSKAAADAGYLPEWVVAGDLLQDAMSNARAQDQRAWSHAWLVGTALREDRLEDSPCRQAFREGDPNGRAIDEFNACDIYRGMFQLFTSIQVAGPNLNPQSVDQGQHAIQRQSSPSPYVAACFYDPGDYTCVKDASESWWDPAAPDPDNRAGQAGCWRLVDGGKRYLAGDWSGDDKRVFANPKDPCNDVDSIGSIG